MKKSTKVIATIVAVVLVVTAMVVAIYAATAGNVGINANVSWTAQEGVNLEFWARVTGGDQEKSVAKSTIAPTTTNANAKIQGDLSCSFKDDSDDGVNNPGAITFKYYVKNNSLTPLNIRVTKTPKSGAESGTSASDHKPKVVLISTIGSNSVIANVLSTSGCELKAGETFGYSVELSISSGGTGSINADTGLMKDFDAGVDFLFNVAGSSSSSNTIKTVIDGVETSTPIGDVAGQTLGEFLATKEPEISTGWFFDEGLTQVVTQENLNAPLRADAESTNLYTREASTTGLMFTLSNDGNSYLVEGESETSPSGEVVIPYKYNGKPVTQFNGGVVLPAFKKNTAITSVVLSSNISNINEATFSESSKIISVTIPNSVTSIGFAAFGGCSGLTNVTIPDSVTSIDDLAFFSCGGLTSIRLGDGVKSVGYSIFRSCSGLTSITIGNGVTSIEGGAFSDCSSLTSIKVASGNTTYDSRDNCNAIIETASNTLIQGCKTTIIPNTITSIDSSAFSDCSGLTSITIPNSVTSIGAGAFSGCSGLISIKVASGNAKYDSRDNCNAIIETSSNKLIAGCKTTIIPNTVTSIGYRAFRSCSELTSITIPSSVISIGTSAFSYCNDLTKIYIPSSVITISASDDYDSPFYSCSSTLKIYCEASSKPSGWETYWNYYDSSNACTTYWGKTLADFNAA